MSLYSTIERRMWGDEKFRALSAPPPNAQDLWVYLLTGPHNGSIPGLFVMGEAALAEAKGWPLAATRRCLAEIIGAGMAKFDPQTRLMWLPKGLRHNPPKNPNVVRGWRKQLEVIPECTLRTEALAGLEIGLRSISDAFVDAFAEVLGKRPPKSSSNPSGKASPKVQPKASVPPSPKQEQDQEQDQKQEEEKPSPPVRLDDFTVGNAFLKGGGNTVDYRGSTDLKLKLLTMLGEMNATPAECERVAAYLAAGGASWAKRKRFDLGWLTWGGGTRLAELFSKAEEWDGEPIRRSANDDGGDGEEILGPDMGPSFLRAAGEAFGR